MLDRLGMHIARRDNHAHADAADTPQSRRKVARQANAAVRCRIARHDALMHGDAGPRHPLHEGHRGTAVDVGFVIAVALQDAEHACWRAMPGRPRRHLGFCHHAGRAVHLNALALHRDDGDQRLRRPHDDGHLRHLYVLGGLTVRLGCGFTACRPYLAGTLCVGPPALARARCWILEAE